MVGRDVGDAATVIDRTDRDEATGVIALSETVRAAHALADDLAVAMADLPGRRPLVVGGDCSILLGIFPRCAGTWVRRDCGSSTGIRIISTDGPRTRARRRTWSSRCGDVPPAGRPRLGSTRRRRRATGAVTSTRGGQRRRLPPRISIPPATRRPECSTFSDAPCREREDPGSCRRWTGSAPAAGLCDRAHIHSLRELIAGLAR